MADGPSRRTRLPLLRPAVEPRLPLLRRALRNCLPGAAAAPRPPSAPADAVRRPKGALEPACLLSGTGLTSRDLLAWRLRVPMPRFESGTRPSEPAFRASLDEGTAIGRTQTEHPGGSSRKGFVAADPRDRKSV